MFRAPTTVCWLGAGRIKDRLGTPNMMQQQGSQGHRIVLQLSSVAVATRPGQILRAHMLSAQVTVEHCGMSLAF